MTKFDYNLRRIANSFLIPLGMMSLSTWMNAAEIVAHRGASYDAPENTAASARLAWEQGADAVEFDIRITTDGKIIAIHDKSTKRTTGVPGKAEEMSFEELRKLDAGSWKDASFAGEKLPTLEEMLATTPSGKRLFVEIKSDQRIVPVLKKSLEASGLKPEQIVLIAFDYETIKEAKRTMPQYEALWIVGYKPDPDTGRLPYELEEMIRMCKEAGLDGLDLNFQWPIDEEFVRKVHDARLKLCTWVVNDAEIARNQARWGVDGITTDRPGWIREQLAAEAESSTMP